jgi:hypothetical protein
MKRIPFLIGLLFIVGCGTTALFKVERDPNFRTTTIRRVLVISLSQNQDHRRVIEDEFVRQWQPLGVTIVASYFALEKDTLLDKAHVAPIAKEQGFDTVLVSRLVGRGKIDPRIPAWDFETDISSSDKTLSKDYPVLVASPAYSPTYEQAVVLTNVYSVSAGKKLWSVTSQTLVTESFPKLVQTYVKEILKALYQSPPS